MSSAGGIARYLDLEIQPAHLVGFRPGALRSGNGVLRDLPAGRWVNPQPQRFGLVVPVCPAPRIGSQCDVHPCRCAGPDTWWDYRDLHVDQPSSITQNAALRVGGLLRLGIGLERSRMSDLRTIGFDRQRNRLFTSGRDLPDRLFGPVVKRVRFGQSRTVLLNPPPPDVLVRVRGQGPAPVIDGILKVTGNGRS